MKKLIISTVQLLAVLAIVIYSASNLHAKTIQLPGTYIGTTNDYHSLVSIGTEVYAMDSTDMHLKDGDKVTVNIIYDDNNTIQDAWIEE